MIEIERVTRRYGLFTAVDDVSLSIAEGQIVGILGPNGAGKTTAVRMIAGVLPPTAGRVTVAGFDSIAQTVEVRRRLGYLPENNPLYPEMRVREYLRYRAGLFSIAGSERRRAVDRSIERCRLGEMTERRIGKLSKGYRQRVGLAAALLHNPPVLILDEPTSGLDPSQIAETRRLMRELAGTHTTLLVSHILPEVEKTCDRIVIFARGSIRADGSPAQVVASAAAGQAAEVVVEAKAGRGGTVEEVLAKVSGSRVAQCSRQNDWTRCRVAATANAALLGERIGKACMEAGLVVRELRRQAASLEEVYIHLIEQADQEQAAMHEGMHGESQRPPRQQEAPVS